ncbi:MAG TPA: hypothetical protein VGI81_00765 [Tepidisphaeraceae bacterium]|jgi:hypothetical protein
MSLNSRPDFSRGIGGRPSRVSATARREAARAIALLWLGRTVDRASLTAVDGGRVTPVESNALIVGLTLAPAEQDALVHLAAHAAAHRGGRASREASRRDPDLRLARRATLPPGRTLAELDQLIRRYLAQHADLLNALAATLQARGTVEGIEVRRMALRARLRRPPGR